MQVRSVNAINHAVFFGSKKLNKGEDDGTLVVKNLDEKQIFNFLNFTAVKPDFEAKHFKVPEVKLQDEQRLSRIARQNGVNTPVINSDGLYKINYDKANLNNNPITPEHLDKALDEINKMDEIGLIHGDIEEAHVFYSKKSNDVEFDCFRFGYLTQDSPHGVEWDFGESQYPTNLIQFENNCIGKYIEEMESEDEKDNFLKGYLPKASEFHRKRAYYLEESGKGTKEQIENEKSQALMYSDPDETTIQLFKERIQLERNQRQFFTDWDEGNGACGHEPDEDRAIGAVLSHFDSLQGGVEFYNKVSALEKNAAQAGKTPDEHFFAYTKEYAEHFIDCRVEQLAGKNHEEFQGMPMWTLNPQNKVNQCHKNISDEQKERFNDVLRDLKDASINSKAIFAKEGKAFYEELLNNG